MEAIKVADGTVTPLRFDSDDAPEPDDFVQDQEDSEEGDKPLKPLNPQAGIFDGADFLVSFHFNRTWDGLVEFSWNPRRDLLLVCANVSKQPLKIDSNQILSGHYLTRKVELEVYMDAYYNRPDVAASIEAARRESALRNSGRA